MDNKKLSMDLRKQARELNICDEWFNAWKDDTDKQELIEMFYKGIDFCLKHRYPTNQYIKENYEIELLRANNILVDDERSLLNPERSAIFGNSKAKVRVNGFNISVIYIRDYSKISLTARNNACVIIHAFEKAEISADVFDSADIVVIKHSKDVVIHTPERVKIKEEYDYLS